VTILTDTQLSQCDNDFCPAKPERGLPEGPKAAAAIYSLINRGFQQCVSEASAEKL
jgi:hypothetical protein